MYGTRDIAAYYLLKCHRTNDNNVWPRINNDTSPILYAVENY